MKRGKYLDLVIGGPDMSGTSTQIKDIINFFQNKEMIVKDLRGTETAAIFHTEKFQNELKKMGRNKKYLNFEEFLSDSEKYRTAGVSLFGPNDFLLYAHKLLNDGGTNQDLAVASMLKNNITSYINPNSADVWIMEEPTKRGAGQVNRVIEQNRSLFGDKLNPFAAALSHQSYRTDEAFRFRLPLRENNKIIVRSRSEESACYQIYDKKFLPKGIKIDDYLDLPGHEIAFKNSPTNIFVVCGPENWTTKDYFELKKERSDGRNIDDHESNSDYQVMVNNRYATDWLERLYEKANKIYGGQIPEITRISIYDSKEEIKLKMKNKLESLF
jgi:hypothetical protein